MEGVHRVVMKCMDSKVHMAVHVSRESHFEAIRRSTQVRF
jgi:hypothetical protein